MTSSAALDAERRAALLGAKLRALVGAALGVGDLESLSFPGGAAAVSGSCGYVLLDDAPERSLGRAIAWASSRGIEDLHVLADDHADVVARRAGLFAHPPSVWCIEGRELVPASPAPPAQPLPPPEGVDSLVELLRAAGLEVMVEHGEIVGELLGLVVARIVTTGGAGINGEPGPRLEVGVGRHDREAFALVHGDLPAADALASVVASVRAQRHPGGDNHPLNRLAPQRWLRDVVRRHPELVDLTQLEPAEAAVPPAGVKDPDAAIGVGRDRDGRQVVAAFSTGIDLDVIPAAADARLMHRPGARLIVVVPERDAHPVSYRMAASLADPAEIVTVPSDWRR